MVILAPVAYVFKDREVPVPWPEFKRRIRVRLFIPFHYVSWLADWAAYCLGKWPMVELLEYLGSFSILFAAIFYFCGAPDRMKQKHYQAWQVINTAQGKGGNGGRIDALQELNEDGISLVGVDVADAYLYAVQLKKAKLRRATFSSCDLRLANLEYAGLQQANLYYANLRGANLRGCDLDGATLDQGEFVGACLAGANLDGVSMTNADLRGADLSCITNWRLIKAIDHANILDVKNPPPGFVEWAKKNGAVEVVIKGD